MLAKNTLTPVATVAVALITGVMLALWVALMPVPAQAVQAANKTVTKTFSDAQPITIPAYGGQVGGADKGKAKPYPSEMNVGGFRKGRILDVNLKLKNYTHTNPDDVDVLLVHPRGINRTVMSDVGGTGTVKNITLSLDDEAATLLPDVDRIVDGTFKPYNFELGDTFDLPAPSPSNAAALSGFDGLNPNGTWELYVYDDNEYLGSYGEFAGGWSLKIKAKVRR